MANSFLHKVTEYINNHNIGYDNTCIILPNKRAGLFLKKQLSENITKPVWAPGIHSIEEFFVTISSIETCDNTTLCFELYSCYKEINNTEIEPLEEFLKWAPQLINDFSEIDSYDINGHSLFGNLSEVKEIESWSLAQEQLTELQKKYLIFWHQLGDLYIKYREHLTKLKKGYQGLIQQTALNKLDEKIGSLPWNTYVFAGFNALNKCEKSLIDKLISLNKAHVIWDSDTYYLKNEQQEAGLFLRKQYEDFSKNEKLQNRVYFVEENGLLSEEKNITITGTAKNILQARVAGAITEQLLKKHIDIHKTAIVLADENLLFPVLNSIPESIKNINITMGYPLKHSLIAELTEIIFALHLRSAKLGKPSTLFYHKDIVKLIKHPYIKSLLFLNGNYKIANQLVDKIQSKSLIFISYNHIEKVFGTDSFIVNLFKPWNNSIDALNCIEYIVEQIAKNIADNNKSENEKESITIEFLSGLMSIIKQIKTLHVTFNENMSFTALELIINQLIRNTSVPFYGEPLRGLQIMGMLETRTLDFENVILLSCNEGILPSGRKNNSFIPYDIRRAFGLPTYSEKDAVFGYHFYRLLQRAKMVHIVYNTETDEFGSGEKSRFLTQLITELPIYNKKATIKEYTLNSSSIINKERVIEIQKTTEVEKKINLKIQAGISPTSLNMYRNCSLRFYFHHIAGIQEAEDVSETIGADTLGSIIHKTLHELYKPYLNKIIDVNILNHLLSQSSATLEKAFEDDESVGEINSGKNLLTVAVAKKITNKFLNSEIAFVEKNTKNGKHLIIQDLEKEFSYTLSINNRNITLKGFCDRIDSTGDFTRIIDYKTGQALNKELEINTWEEIRTNIDLDKSFQLLMYALLYSKNQKIHSQKLISGIISFRELSAGLKGVKINGTNLLTNEILNKFEEELRLLLKDLLDTSISFKQTNNPDVCEYCSFKIICNR